MQAPQFAEGSGSQKSSAQCSALSHGPHTVSSPAVLAVLAVGLSCATVLLDKWAVHLSSVHKATEASDWNMQANDEFKLGNSVSQGIIFEIPTLCFDNGKFIQKPLFKIENIMLDFI